MRQGAGAAAVRMIRNDRHCGASSIDPDSIDIASVHHKLTAEHHGGLRLQAAIGRIMRTGFASSMLISRMASVADLAPDELKCLAAMPCKVTQVGSRQTVLRHGVRATECCLLLKGYLFWRDENAANGQITAISVPGDIANLQTLYCPHVIGTLTAAGPAVVARVPHGYLRALSMRAPELWRALLSMMTVDHAIQRTWTLSIGSRNALMRVAHLLCEIVVRLQAVGLAANRRLSSSFTQSDVAAACGISAVHANRIIQKLRRCGLVQWEGKDVTITDWQALVRISGFNPAYLAIQPAGQRGTEPSPPVKPTEAHVLVRAQYRNYIERSRRTIF